MKTYQIPVTRQANCTLQTMVEVSANSREEAENEAIGLSESGLKPDDFTVAEIDLTAFEGSTKVLP